MLARLPFCKSPSIPQKDLRQGTSAILPSLFIPVLLLSWIQLSFFLIGFAGNDMKPTVLKFSHVPDTFAPWGGEWCDAAATLRLQKFQRSQADMEKKLRNDWFILLTTCAALTLLPCPLLGISLQSSIPHMYRRWSSLLRNMALIDVIQAACSLHPAITWSSPNLSKEFMGEADLRAAFSAHCKTSSLLSETGSTCSHHFQIELVGRTQGTIQANMACPANTWAFPKASLHQNWIAALGVEKSLGLWTGVNLENGKKHLDAPILVTHLCLKPSWGFPKMVVPNNLGFSY